MVLQNSLKVIPILSMYFHVSCNLTDIDLFQAMFHHIFLRGMEDIAQSVNVTGAYTLEFEPKRSQCILS